MNGTAQQQQIASDNASAPTLWLILAGIAIVSVLVLYRSAYNASNLEVVPDSVEYAIGGNSIATDGRYDIVVGGHSYPPRYPPWFSALVIAPSYALIGREIGNAIFPVTFFGLVGILAAFAIGRRVSGNLSGLFSALLLLALPVYRNSSRQIMTDVPCAALILLQCLIYVRLRSGDCRLPLIWYSIAGILCALCGAFRPICSVALIPLLLCAVCAPERREKLARIILVSLPTVLLIAATFAYNSRVFGSPLRSGYNFWCPVPYDYPGMVFSWAYVARNLDAMLSSGLVALALAAIVMFLLDARHIRTFSANPAARQALAHVIEFLLIGAGPVVLFHLGYFFPEERFFLPALAILAVMAGSIAGAWMPQTSQRTVVLMLAALAIITIPYRMSAHDAPPHRRISADNILRHTPDNAVIVSSIDPAYLEFFVSRHSHRTVIPLSRTVEYASKLIATNKVANPQPPPKDWSDHRCGGLRAGGAKDVIQKVFVERIPVAEMLVGTPVFLDTTSIAEADQLLISLIQERFRLVPRADYLYEMILEDSQSSERGADQSAAGTAPQSKSDTQTSAATPESGNDSN